MSIEHMAERPKYHKMRHEFIHTWFAPSFSKSKCLVYLVTTLGMPVNKYLSINFVSILIFVPQNKVEYRKIKIFPFLVLLFRFLFIEALPKINHNISRNIER